MQQFLLPLNPKSGAEFVNVYTDDVIILSSSLEEHRGNLHKVVYKLMEAGLKLKPSQCHFTRAEVEYLVSAAGLKLSILPCLTRKDVPFDWMSECQAAFEELNSKLTSAPVLAYPNFNKDFVLETDASYLD